MIQKKPEECPYRHRTCDHTDCKNYGGSCLTTDEHALSKCGAYFICEYTSTPCSGNCKEQLSKHKVWQLESLIDETQHQLELLKKILFEEEK